MEGFPRNQVQLLGNLLVISEPLVRKRGINFVFNFRGNLPPVALFGFPAVTPINVVAPHYKM